MEISFAKISSDVFHHQLITRTTGLGTRLPVNAFLPVSKGEFYSARSILYYLYVQKRPKGNLCHSWGQSGRKLKFRFRFKKWPMTFIRTHYNI